MMRQRWISLGLGLMVCFLTVSVWAGGKKGQNTTPQINPISVGAYWGSVTQYYPNLTIIATLPDCYTSFVGELWLMKHYSHNNIATSYVRGLNDEVFEEIKSLLDGARELAIKHKARFYGVSNMRLHIVHLQNAVLLVLTGDEFCAR